MKSMILLRKKITVGTLCCAVICQIVSFFFLGWNLLFSIGLLLGTGTAIINFFLMESSMRKTIFLGNRWSATGGYFIRLALYGITFYMAIRIHLVCALGAGLGFFTLKIALIYLGIKGKL